MAALPVAFVAKPWEEEVPAAWRVQPVWMPVSVVEMYRDAYAMLRILEARGVKQWPGYAQALAELKSTASTPL